MLVCLHLCKRHAEHFGCPDKLDPIMGFGWVILGPLRSSIHCTYPGHFACSSILSDLLHMPCIFQTLS